MGTQVTVELKDLKEAGWDYSLHRDMDDTGEEYLVVHVPVLGVRVSILKTAFVFDNKFINHDIREQLDKYRVPYVRA